MRQFIYLILFIIGFLPVSIPAQEPIRIACVGNSITEGFSNSSQEMAWPAQLNRLLGRHYAVFNCGVSGTTMFKNSDAPYWKTGQFERAKSVDPDILIMALGTNDADPWRWNTLKEEFIPDYMSMIAEFRKDGKDPVIYICLPPPLFGPGKQPQNKVIENELIPILKEISKEIGATVIDYHYPLIDKGETFPDNVHPDDSGSTLMAQIVYEAIQSNQVIHSHITVKKGEITEEGIVLVKNGSQVLYELRVFLLIREAAHPQHYEYLQPKQIRDKLRG